MGLGNVDPVQIVIGILNGNWDPQVIAKPTIAKKAEQPTGSVNAEAGDFVLVYPLSRRHRFADSNANWQGVTVEVAVDMRTDDDGDMNAIISEVERICRVKRVDPSPEFDLLDYAGIDYQQNYGKLYRNVATVRLAAHCRSIVGG